MFSIPNEDDYLEQCREAYENPRRYRHGTCWDEDLVLDSDILSLDEEVDSIEAEYACSMENLPEADLIDIVQRLCGILPESAKWVRRWCAIDYRYNAADWN